MQSPSEFCPELQELIDQLHQDAADGLLRGKRTVAKGRAAGDSHIASIGEGVIKAASRRDEAAIGIDEVRQEILRCSQTNDPSPALEKLARLIPLMVDCRTKNQRK